MTGVCSDGSLTSGHHTETYDHFLERTLNGKSIGNSPMLSEHSKVGQSGTKVKYLKPSVYFPWGFVTHVVLMLSCLDQSKCGEGLLQAEVSVLKAFPFEILRGVGSQNVHRQIDEKKKKEKKICWEVAW